MKTISPARLSLVAALGVALVILVFFRDVVFLGHSFFERDIQIFWYGQTASFLRQWAAGSWPLWDPSQSFGQPFLANPSTQMLYPCTWLSLVLAPETQYTVFAVGHVVLSALGLLLLARHLGLTAVPASVAALAWALSGPLLSLVSLWHHLAGAAWIPWVMLAAFAILERPDGRRIAALAGAVSLQMLAGSADMVLMTGVAVAALVASRIDWRHLTGAANMRILEATTLAAGLALAAAAVQWLPALSLAQASVRRGLPESMRTFWSLHPLNAAQLLLPLLPQRLSLDPSWWNALYGASAPLLSSLYLGLVGLPLALLGAMRGTPPARFLSALGVGALVIALGTYGLVYSFLVGALPFLRILRYPVKATIFVAFAWSLLVGLGLEAWRRREGGDRGRTVATASALALVVVMALGSGLLAQVPAAGLLAAVQARSTLVAVAVLALSAYVVLWMSGRRAQPRPMAGFLLGVAVVADLLIAHSTLNPTAPRGTFTAPPPVVQALAHETPGRLFTFEYSDLVGKSYRRPEANRVYSMPSEPMARARALWAYPVNPMGRQWGLETSYERDTLGLAPSHLQGLSFILRLAEETPGFLRLLRMGSVEYVMALHTEGLEDLELLGTFESPFPTPIRLYRVPRSFPRAYVVGQAVRADGREGHEALADPAFEPEKTVLLASGDVMSPTGPFEGTTRITEQKPDHLRVEVDLSGPGYLVVTQAFDRGWGATLDGNRTTVERANLAFQAVRAPAGHHVVELIYRPPLLLYGLFVSGTALLVGLAWASVSIRGGLLDARRGGVAPDQDSPKPEDRGQAGGAVVERPEPSNRTRREQ
jgi:membrane protein YfhO